MKIATNPNFDMAGEGEVFSRTFRYLDDALGARAFKRWNGYAFSGKFLMSVFEVLATARSLWRNPVFEANPVAGVRGTTRLSRLLPIAGLLLNPHPNPV